MALILNQKDADYYRKVLKAHTKKICKTKESARAYLIKLGIYNEDGTITSEYGEV